MLRPLGAGVTFSSRVLKLSAMPPSPLPVPTAPGRLQSFAEFWPYYLGEHAKRPTRALHYVGTTGVFFWLATAAISQRPAVLVYAPLSAYGCAWLAHFLVEKNKPATFKHPLWSLLGDFRMYFLALTGRLGPHLDAAGVKD